MPITDAGYLHQRHFLSIMAGNEIKGNNILGGIHMPNEKQIDEAIERIFNSVSNTIANKRHERITLNGVDHTIDALFSAIEDARKLGKKAAIPDFERILETEQK